MGDDFRMIFDMDNEDEFGLTTNLFDGNQQMVEDKVQVENFLDLEYNTGVSESAGSGMSGVEWTEANAFMETTFLKTSPISNTPQSPVFQENFKKSSSFKPPTSAVIDVPRVDQRAKDFSSDGSFVSGVESRELQSGISSSSEQKRKAPVKWSDAEEKRFIEALQLYGRDWKKCAQHVGTRDANNFRSHAQKYFIRLYKNGLPVPRKVSETGEGHTLSGKSLDPNSAAARCYLNGRSYRSDLAKRHRQDQAKTGKALSLT